MKIGSAVLVPSKVGWINALAQCAGQDQHKRRGSSNYLHSRSSTQIQECYLMCFSLLSAEEQPTHTIFKRIRNAVRPILTGSGFPTILLLLCSQPAQSPGNASTSAWSRTCLEHGPKNRHLTLQK